MPKMHNYLMIGFAGIALAACNPVAAVDKTDPEVVQGQRDARSGKHGPEAQAFAKEMDSLNAMSHEDRARHLSAMNAANKGK